MTPASHKLWKDNFHFARAELRAEFKRKTHVELDEFFQDLAASIEHHNSKALRKAVLALILVGEFIYKNFPPQIHEPDRNLDSWSREGPETNPKRLGKTRNPKQNPRKSPNN